MSNETWACYADTVEEDFIQEICPYEWAMLQDFLKREDLTGSKGVY